MKIYIVLIYIFKINIFEIMRIITFLFLLLLSTSCVDNNDNKHTVSVNSDTLRVVSDSSIRSGRNTSRDTILDTTILGPKQGSSVVFGPGK